MIPASNAWRFFHEIKENPLGSLAYLQELVSSGAEENEWREFKGAHHLTAIKGKDDDLLAIWSKALSAFANASGGVLIFGVHAPSRGAESLSLAVDAAKLAERLRAKILVAVEPIVPGVEILPILLEGSEEGFVVCLIPQSRLAPHQATLPYRQFYLRCQDGSHPCPYSALRRLFQPSYSPVFRVSARLQVSRGNDSRLAGSLWVTNTGNASAHNVFFTHTGGVQIGCGKLFTPISGNNKGFTMEMAIHPGQTIFVGSFSHALQFPHDFEKAEVVRLESKFYCSNSPPLTHYLSVAGSDLKGPNEGNGEFEIVGVDTSDEPR